MGDDELRWRDPVGLSALPPFRHPICSPEALELSLALSRAPLAEGVMQRSGGATLAGEPAGASMEWVGALVDGGWNLLTELTPCVCMYF